MTPDRTDTQMEKRRLPHAGGIVLPVTNVMTAPTGLPLNYQDAEELTRERIEAWKVCCVDDPDLRRFITSEEWCQLCDLALAALSGPSDAKLTRAEIEDLKNEICPGAGADPSEWPEDHGSQGSPI